MSAPPRRVVVVGASAAGLRCAARLKRLLPDCRVTVVEERAAFSYAACGLPYVLSGDIAELDDLRRTAYGAIRDRRYFEAVKGIELLEGHRAVAVDPDRRLVTVEGPSGPHELGWDDLVLATGARGRRLPGQPEHPRVRTFHTWDDVAPLKRALARGELERVAVVGAGMVGVELAEAFRSLWGAEVTVLEAAPHPLPAVLDPEPAALVAAELERQGVDLRCGAPVGAVVPDGEAVAVRVGGEELRVDAVVVAVGVEPRGELARAAGVELGATGAIRVDGRLATSVPHVWAAGDCVEVTHAVTGERVHLPLGSLANRQGRVLANVLAGRDDRFGPVAGTVAVKAFDLVAAATGCSLEAARARGLAARAIWVTTDDRAHYWPEAERLYLEAVVEEGSGRLLGVQAVGRDRAAAAVDLAAQVILAGGTADDLLRIEHGYAPPVAPALSPLHVLAAAAANAVEGVRPLPPRSTPGERAVLDVRLPEEREARPWPGRSRHVPLEELRSRLGEVAAGGPWLVVCERGARSAEAVRLLSATGVDAVYLGGGMLWRHAAGGGP